jgi:hypothetical protein
MQISCIGLLSKLKLLVIYNCILLSYYYLIIYDFLGLTTLGIVKD